MTRLLVFSDTHYPSRRIPGKFYDLILDDGGRCLYDGIIHCGDIQEIEFYEELLGFDIPVYAVLGNNYDFMLEQQIPRRRILFIEDVRIGIVHGNGSFAKAIDNARREFSSEEVDLVCFGHSHVSTIEKIGVRDYFNPGSLTCSRSGFNSYGILEIDGRDIKMYIKELV